MMACSPTGIRNAAHYIDIPNNWIRGVDGLFVSYIRARCAVTQPNYPFNYANAQGTHIQDIFSTWADSGALRCRHRVFTPVPR